MDKKLIVEEIAARSSCALRHFKDIAYHELRHMGVNPREFDKEIEDYINEEENNIREANKTN